MSTKDHIYYGHGKLLLTGEYFVLDGALSLALPTTVGQTLSVKYRPSFEPQLNWRSYHHDGSVWLEAQFEFWHFDLIHWEGKESEVLLLQKILRQARKQNTHFLRDEGDVTVETRLEFPINWGLGASSTLIHNISQWALVSPFELLNQTIGGSGFDVACAQSLGPILYKRGFLGPKWTMIPFDPPFKDQLFFVYLGKKQNSQNATQFYRQAKAQAQAQGQVQGGWGPRELKEKIIAEISQITQKIMRVQTLKEFEDLILRHEDIVSQTLNLPKVKDERFSDYQDGVIKSLGAWGGDFVLVTGRGPEVRNYFYEKGYDVFIPYLELIRGGDFQLINHRPGNGNKNNIDLSPFFEE